jgi:hypothetical protein
VVPFIFFLFGATFEVAQKGRMAKHTKKPWTILHGTGIIYSPGAGTKIVTCEKLTNGMTGRPPKNRRVEWEANIRLVAAAPDMLGALQAVEQLGDVLDVEVRYEGEARSLREIVKEILAKVEGPAPG